MRPAKEPGGGHVEWTPSLSRQVANSGRTLLVWCWAEGREWGSQQRGPRGGQIQAWSTARSLGLRDWDRIQHQNFWSAAKRLMSFGLIKKDRPYMSYFISGRVTRTREAELTVPLPCNRLSAERTLPQEPAQGWGPETLPQKCASPVASLRDSEWAFLSKCCLQGTQWHTPPIYRSGVLCVVLLSTCQVLFATWVANVMNSVVFTFLSAVERSPSGQYQCCPGSRARDLLWKRHKTIGAMTMKNLILTMKSWAQRKRFWGRLFVTRAGREVIPGARICFCRLWLGHELAWEDSGNFSHPAGL